MPYGVRTGAGIFGLVLGVHLSACGADTPDPSDSEAAAVRGKQGTHPGAPDGGSQPLEEPDAQVPDAGAGTDSAVAPEAAPSPWDAGTKTCSDGYGNTITCPSNKVCGCCKDYGGATPTCGPLSYPISCGQGSATRGVLVCHDP